MSTYDRLLARGIRVRDVVIAPELDGSTLAQVTRLHFEYAMVRYASGATRGYLPELLSPAPESEREQYNAAVAAQDPWRAEG